VDTLAFFWSLPANAYDAWRNAGLTPWKERVLGYWPELAPFIAQFKSVDDLTFAHYSDTIMKRWYDDRIVFIGDAAHCTSPQLGQGANLGLIDALTLATCLKEAPDLEGALANYNKKRHSHTNFYQIASRWLTPFFQSDSKAAAWLRDRTFGLCCKTPYLKTEMLRTLAGIKTGPFTFLDPGMWHKDYALRKVI
jgi:salicylate hydroxylase